MAKQFFVVINTKRNAGVYSVLLSLCTTLYIDAWDLH